SDCSAERRFYRWPHADYRGIGKRASRREEGSCCTRRPRRYGRDVLRAAAGCSLFQAATSPQAPQQCGACFLAFKLCVVPAALGWFVCNLTTVCGVENT